MSAKLVLSRSLVVVGAAATSFLVGTPLALAQEATASEPVKIEEIYVTGSRIKRPDFETANPVVSITAESIRLSGTTNLTDFLMSQPALVGSLDSLQTTGSAGFIGSSGLNLLNLRNLGTERTLVLVDGRRHVAQLPESASVDVDTIPQDLIERIDVATGGVSAVYGADAVSGVVNFIMKKDFEGFTARAQYGQADRGKPVDWHAAVTAGTNFAGGRGNIAGSIEHTQEGRLKATDRHDFRGSNYRLLMRNVADEDNGDDPNVPDRIPLNDIRFFDSSREGAIDTDFDFVPDLRPNGEFYDAFGGFIPPFYSQGGPGTLVADYIGDLLADNQNTIVSSFLNFEFSEKARLFGEVKYARGKSYSESQPTFDYYLLMTADNPYVPEGFVVPGALGALFEDPSFPDAIQVSRDNFDMGVRAEDNTRDTWRTVLGMKGDLSEDLRYEFSYVYGQTKVKNRATNNRWNDRFYAALDVVTDPETGDPVCRSNLDPSAVPFQPFQNFDISQVWPDNLSFTPGPNSGCLPLNLLGEGAPNRAAVDWVMLNTLATSKITQNVFNAFISGDVPGLELPGGKIGYVFGVEWRRETSKSDPPAEDLTGLTFGNVILPTDGAFDVKEAFTEFVLPVLKDKPFAHSLELNAALRLSDYSTVGKTTTWNVGVDWSPIRSVAFRGTLAQSVRAPNIGELFGPQSQTFEFIDDPCDVSLLNNGTQYRQANCEQILGALGIDPTSYTDPNSSNISGTSGGNDSLSEETARSWTAGVVLRPEFMPGLALSIDMYDIKIKQAINTATPEQLAENCVDQPTIDNVFCDSLTRDPDTGAIDGFVLQPENVANFRTRGVDYNMNYTINPADLGVESDIGMFNLNVVGSHLTQLTFIPTPGAEVQNDLGTQYAPEWVTNIGLTWRRGPLTIAYDFHYFGKTLRYSYNTLAGDPDQASEHNIKYDARRTSDMQVAYDFEVGPSKLQLYGGVKNLTDQKPDLTTGYPVSPVGRFLYVGAVASIGTND